MTQYNPSDMSEKMRASVADGIEDAADLLEKGWTQGAYHNGYDDAYCAVGALRRAILDRLAVGHATQRYVWAIAAISAAVSDKFTQLGYNNEDIIIYWNDAGFPNQTKKQEVLDLFRRVAKEVRLG